MPRTIIINDDMVNAIANHLNLKDRANFLSVSRKTYSLSKNHNQFWTVAYKERREKLSGVAISQNEATHIRSTTASINMKLELFIKEQQLKMDARRNFHIIKNMEGVFIIRGTIVGAMLGALFVGAPMAMIGIGAPDFSSYSHEVNMKWFGGLGGSGAAFGAMMGATLPILIIKINTFIDINNDSEHREAKDALAILKRDIRPIHTEEQFMIKASTEIINDSKNNEVVITIDATNETIPLLDSPSIRKNFF